MSQLPELDRKVGMLPPAAAIADTENCVIAQILQPIALPKTASIEQPQAPALK